MSGKSEAYSLLPGRIILQKVKPERAQSSRLPSLLENTSLCPVGLLPENNHNQTPQGHTYAIFGKMLVAQVSPFSLLEFFDALEDQECQ